MKATAPQTRPSRAIIWSPPVDILVLTERLKFLETHLAMRYGEIRLSRADMIDLIVYVKSTVASGITPSSD